VLNRLPQVQPNAEQNFADSEGRQRVKLRSLGYERTLTLVDGLRLGIQNGLDVGIIPTTLVDRVDVLTGGASSVYGSDAVSGVVNFILKKNFDGLEITGGDSLYNHDNRANPVTLAAANANFAAPRGMTNDGGRANVTMSAGKTLFDGAFNITGFIGYRHSDVVPFRARSTSACEVTQPNRDGPLVCTSNTYTQAGTIIPRSGASNGQTLVNNPDGSRTFVPFGSGPNTRANPFDDFAFQREFNRINAGGFMTLTLSKAAEVYATMLAYRDRSENPVPLRIYPSGVYGSTPYRVNCDNPFLSASQARTLCGTNAGSATTAPLDLRYRFDGLPPASNRFENKGLRVTGGVRGRVLDDAWTYDVAGVYSSNRATTIFPAFPDFDRVNRTLNVVSVGGAPTCASVVNGTDRACVPFNAFTAFNNNAAVTDYIFQSVDGTQFSKPTMWQGLATVSGDLGKYGITSPLAEQGIAVAFGVEYRAEKFVSGADAQFRLTNGGTDARFTQNVWEGNVEVQVPLIEERSWTQLLQVNGGYRRSKYNRLSRAFDTWKGEALWAPIDDITFRGSINKAQAAPSLFQVVQAENITYTNTNGSAQDPCAAGSGQNGNPRASLAACRATGLPDNLYGSASLVCPNNACTIRGGGFGLTPETAYTKTFGVVVRPRFLPGLTLSVDRFLIDLNDSIGLFSANDYIVGCIQTQDPYYCRGIVRNPGTFTLNSPAAGNPTTGFIIQGTTNGYKSKSHGWDFQAQWAIGLASAGKLDLSFNGTRMTLVGGQDAPNIAPRNCVGYYGPTCGESLPRWTHTMLTTYSPVDKSFSASVNWRYTGSQTVTYNAADAALGIPFTRADRRNTYNGIKSYSYFDLALSFDVVKRMNLRFSVNNVFDKDPPLIPDSRNLLGLLRNNTLFRYDLLGRQFVVGATVRF
jgi:outer membrane receptor protein involved in Fe transport